MDFVDALCIEVTEALSASTAAQAPVEEKKEEKRPVITGSLPEPFETKRLHIPPQTQVLPQEQNVTPEPVRTPENLDVFRQLLVREERQLSYGFRICGFCFDRRRQPDAGDVTGSGMHTGGGYRAAGKTG